LQTADSLRVQGWTDARIAARVPVSSIIEGERALDRLLPGVKR
jgi:hypothetical protein